MKSIVVGNVVCEFDEKEKKIRRNWLILTCLPYVFCFVLFRSLLKDQELLTGMFLGSLLYSWGLLHCTYKKHGTALLRFTLIATPIFTAIYFIQDLFVKDLIGILIEVALILVLFLPWFLSSLKMLKLNTEILANKQKGSMTFEYLESIERLKKAESLEELNVLFSKITETWPFLDEASSREYALLKQKFCAS